MADNNSTAEPMLRHDGEHADKYGTKLVDKTQKYQKKFDDATPGSDKKGPAGGFDATPVPKAPPGYTLRITIHRAENLPFADIPSFSSDPYIIAIVKTALQKRHKQDSDLTLRTPTFHRTTNPKWEAVWTIAHVPASGFNMKCRIYDEDPTDHDDRLGNVHVNVDRIDDNWKGYKERKFDVKKRMGSKRAYTFRACASLISRNIKMGGEVYISVENLGRSEGNGGRAYTVSPLPWSQHYSPLIGRLTGTKDRAEGQNGGKATEKYNFQAIQMQLRGPVPEALYHRYVEFKPFVAGMFTSHSFRGRILNHALHHQHARVYNFDGSTHYGHFDEPSLEMTKKFLDFVHYDQGGRIFTYVITLDGQLRFTETGKEFGIDMLSKHTMHSDVSIYIAFSGEFFVRRLKNPHKEKDSNPDAGKETMPPTTEEPDEIENEKEPEQGEKRREHRDTLTAPADNHMSESREKRSISSPTSQSSARKNRKFSGFHRRSTSATSSHSPAPHAPQTLNNEEPTKDPSHYELIIDNDSGTYRPNAKYLPELKKFLQANFPGMRIATLDCQKDEEKMSKLKNEQRERKKKSGKQIMYMQNSSLSSISSSEEEELERRADAQDGAAHTNVVKKEWEKVKHLGHDDKAEKSADSKEKDAGTGAGTDAGADTGAGAAAISSSSHRKHSDANKMSISTNKGSFDTAETGFENDHFVTPKPSLGDGGLKAFEEEDRPLSRDINKELEKRGLEQLEQDSAQTGKANEHTSGAANPASFHHAVTGTT